ncbi:hypothetical protein ASD8599_03636 [Ascidiaceihabitans donghaensis]|uniref:Uncharacterized protein n=1 Tax=Ascidiaceihabitans donghaensis TaxID=1510460 RepID=A0A2R8BIS5_9RHOB|nr:hypothetical protein ASD8599_03636 [Ascidiaceihabitans donghaensis]
MTGGLRKVWGAVVQILCRRRFSGKPADVALRFYATPCT